MYNAVPPRLTDDLRQPHVTAYYPSGDVQVKAEVLGLDMRPFLVVADQAGRHFSVPLGVVERIEVDGETSHVEASRRDRVIVADWRRASWGELVRLTP
ncbi:hypothetical protein HYV91_00620 [Candidatus Wolfebacteria bacterium]|nr:hypothetical protein [Candidatus Wolfebacteria bacterium]